MPETLTICNECNRSTSGQCWRHGTVAISLCDHVEGTCAACEERRSPLGRHADIVQNEWGLRQQRRVGWVTSNFAWLPDGTYVFTTEFHEDDECLFRDREVVQFEPLTATGEASE